MTNIHPINAPIKRQLKAGFPITLKHVKTKEDYYNLLPPYQFIYDMSEPIKVEDLPGSDGNKGKYDYIEPIRKLNNFNVQKRK